MDINWKAVEDTANSNTCTDYGDRCLRDVSCCASIFAARDMIKIRHELKNLVRYSWQGDGVHPSDTGKWLSREELLAIFSETGIGEGL